MPVVVLTNDDGIHAPGLAALEKALAELGDVYVVAPEREQSACGHALTLHRPLRALKMGERRFAVNGTPSDCANMAVLGFLPETPVLIVSGINHGANLGDDVTYSGTVSAAMEGTILGVPSIAVSLVDGGDFEVAGRVARLIAMRVLVGGLPGNTLLNVNVPPQPPRGIRMTRLGHRVYKEKIVEQADPRGRSHYWIGGGDARWDDLDGTDMGAVHDGYISLTPLHLDLTNHRALVQLADWQGGLNAQFRTETDRPARRAPAPVAAPKPAPAAATKRKPRRG
jgi:5'-nucleotidase